ncbi:hypothetical protein BU23DRAFT_579021 [Bimuria novae-zelandiae CBS 107.79]|uniref:Uncharacterized protein n=1 Tax=Bimuria novae-zelandiae CBS 107.79 TaxID=1447943 RepID=A0A6A5VE81_9PLEO|nr:hypothetical protein BU23DRAFT_579021 [Bimuria novae-zelandiae CBS 107.79]
MRFPTFSVVATLSVMAGLAAPGVAFVMDTYTDSNCNDYGQNVNVWDNTCADWPNAFKSFKITTWGGNHQHGWWFAPDNCGSLPGSIKNGYVDSTTFDFKIGECVSLGDNVANAVASWYG